MFSSAFAATDEFTVRLAVGDDTVPPTTPGALTATPAAQTQIDLSWGVSTDDFIFGGYQVFRDATQIATTTLTTYSDSGLTASTSYTYFIRAFDSVFNISSSSDSVSTSTFPVPATPTPTSTPTTTIPVDSGSGANTTIELVSFNIVPALYTAEVSWETSRYAQYELRWGRDSSYELGFVTSNLFKKDNVTLITDLQPGTVYEYQLVVHGRDGESSILKEGHFKTLDAPDTQAPANISNFKASVDGARVRLSWSNPTDSDFSYVRIVRNYLFYPIHPNDGYVVFQSKGDSFTDEDALAQKDIQYYTAFSYDKSGNISSGAVISVSVPAYVNDTSVVHVSSSTSSSSTPGVTFDFTDIEVVQDGVVLHGGTIDADLPFLLRIAYEKLPEHLKTITVSLTSPDDDNLSFSFLLRINNDKTYYEASIAPLKKEGAYPVQVAVYDYEIQKVFMVSGVYRVTQKAITDKGPLGALSTGVSSTVFQQASFFWILFLILLYALSHLIFNKWQKLAVGAGFGMAKTFLSLFVLVAFGGVGVYIYTHTDKLASSGNSVNSTASALESLPVSNFVVVGSLAILSILFLFLFISLGKKK